MIGPRPALWNQDDLIEERDKYHANEVRPGLTGWAQINGRDELEIPVKARLDGEYVERISFLFDLKCFFGTIASVLKSDGVVEGGTGSMNGEVNDEDISDFMGGPNPALPAAVGFVLGQGPGFRPVLPLALVHGGTGPPCRRQRPAAGRQSCHRP